MVPADTQKEKLRLRGEIRLILQSLSPHSMALKSAEVVSRLSERPDFRNARKMMLYMALRDEVDMRALIEEAISGGSRVFLPRITGERGQMEAVEVRDLAADLVRGPLGIMEPRGHWGTGASASEIDLVFVPGVAFDSQGRRLGRGLGYYDRFLAGQRPGHVIGCCFREQVVARVPCDEYDQTMDEIVYDSMEYYGG